MPTYDIVLLTDSRFTASSSSDQYAGNVILEDQILSEALKKRDLKVHKTNWNNTDFDWTSTSCAMVRTTWDIYDDGKFAQFQAWLEKVQHQTQLINDYSTIRWNIDKSYLQDLERQGIRIPPTIFIPKGDQRTLQEIIDLSGWKKTILKPAVSGGGRHTYKLDDTPSDEVLETFSVLIQQESMLLQEFQEHIVDRGELTLMVFGGKYSHAVLKMAKAGDFRVQDDFGGTIHEYEPSSQEIALAEEVVSVCEPIPTQARVDFIWNNNGDLCVSELELIEPELWFRNHKESANRMAEVIEKKYFKP